MAKKEKAPAKYPLFNMRLEPELIEALDDLRRNEPDLPNRSEIVRRLIRRAAEKKGRK